MANTFTCDMDYRYSPIGCMWHSKQVPSRGAYAIYAPTYSTPTTSLHATRCERASLVNAISMQIDHTIMTCTCAQHLVTATDSRATDISQHTSRCCGCGIMKNAVRWTQAHSMLAGLYTFMRHLLRAHWQARITTDA